MTTMESENRAELPCLARFSMFRAHADHVVSVLNPCYVNGELLAMIKCKYESFCSEEVSGEVLSGGVESGDVDFWEVVDDEGEEQAACVPSACATPASDAGERCMSGPQRARMSAAELHMDVKYEYGSDTEKTNMDPAKSFSVEDNTKISMTPAKSDVDSAQCEHRNDPYQYQSLRCSNKSCEPVDEKRPRRRKKEKEKAKSASGPLLEVGGGGSDGVAGAEPAGSWSLSALSFLKMQVRV